jgi:D-beta-D-heptose 7-phosphate kinase/D-beta-D-heptose 1-phosphate adenosyltransferase
MKILVIGELGVDKFIYGDCTRLNPEAPTPVFKPKNTHSNMGMAGNVLANLKSLGVDVEMIHQQERIVKTRYVDEKSNYILLRVDEEPELEPLKFSNIQDIELTEYDAIIISDYNKGFLTEEMMEYIMVNSSLSFIDTKRPFGKWIKGATYIKVNESESKNPSHNKLVTELVKNRLIITRGGEGCDLNGNNYPTKKVDVRDVAGAGDTFIAAITAAFVKTKEIETSIYFANECATHVIQKRGVADISDMKIIFDKL